MGRLERLQKEITKGLNKTSDLKGDIVERWSPNNLRRLCISPNVIIVEYYVCDGKTKTLRTTIPVEEDFKREFDRLCKDVQYREKTYNSLLSCLTKTKVGKSPRIFSSIEEIVFFGGYPAELFKLDVDLNMLAGINTGRDTKQKDEPLQDTIKSRFKRLKSISVLNASEQQVMDALNKSRGFGTDLVVTLTSQNGIELSYNYVINKNDWWRGTYLRGKEYSMDAEGSKLSNYFRDNITKREETESKDDLDKRYKDLVENKHKNKQEDERDVRNFYKSINATCNDIIEIHDLCKDIYDYSVKLDKVQWAGYLKRDNIFKLVKQDINKRNAIKAQLTKFNAVELKQCLTDYDLDSKFINRVLNILGLELDILPKNTDNIEFDKTVIDRIFKWYLSALTNVAYLVLVKHVLKTGNKEFAMKFHLDKLSIPSIYYSATIVEYINSTLGITDAKKVFDLMDNAIKVNETDLNRVVKATETKKILNALKDYTKL